MLPAPTPDQPVPEHEAPTSEFSHLLPQLHRLSRLDKADPRWATLRAELIVSLLPVVRNLAGRHSAGRPAAREELIQVGTVGLITAIDRWDPERSPEDLLGYVIPCVRGEMLRYFRDRTWAARVPRRLKELSVAIGRVGGDLAQSLGRAPRPSELADYLGADLGEVIEALQAQESRFAGSLEAAAEDGNSPIDRLGEVDLELDHVEYRQALRPLLNQLPDRERSILLMRFFGELSQTQIAERVGISQMHVSRLLARTLAGLRTALLDDSAPEPV
jgi:RNA polymerase sigma-B factor